LVSNSAGSRATGAFELYRGANRLMERSTASVVRFRRRTRWDELHAEVSMQARVSGRPQAHCASTQFEMRSNADSMALSRSAAILGPRESNVDDIVREGRKSGQAADLPHARCEHRRSAVKGGQVGDRSHHPQTRCSVSRRHWLLVTRAVVTPLTRPCSPVPVG